MSRQLLLAFLAASVAAPIPAMAAHSDGDRDNQTVCRRYDGGNLGSNIQRRTRVCKTRAEWRQLEEHTQNELQQVRDGQQPRVGEGASLVPGPGGGPS